MTRFLALALVLAALAAAGCGGGDGAAALPSQCTGAGFVGGPEVADGLFAARIPAACGFGRTRSCTVADGHGPITREVVPAGVAQDCFAFNQFIGAGWVQIPGYAAGECFGVARLSVPPFVERPTFRCDGGKAPKGNAGTRLPVSPPAGPGRIAGLRAPDPWPRPPEAGSVGEKRLATPPPWSLLVWRDERGRTCFEPGQVIDRSTPGRSDQLPGERPVGPGLRRPVLGSLRYDQKSGPGNQLYGVGRFTRYDPSVGGSCGEPGAGAGLLLSWESRYARRDQAFATTVAGGVASPRVRAVAARRGGRWRAVAISRDGAFLVTARGVVGPRELPVRVRYRDGSARTFR